MITRANRDIRFTHVALSSVLSLLVAVTGALGSYHKSMQSMREQMWETRAALERQMRVEVTQALAGQASQAYPVNREYFFDRERGEQLQEDIRWMRSQIAELNRMLIEIHAQTRP